MRAFHLHYVFWAELASLLSKTRFRTGAIYCPNWILPPFMRNAFNLGPPKDCDNIGFSEVKNTLPYSLGMFYG